MSKFKVFLFTSYKGDVSASPLFLPFYKYFVFFDDKVEGIAELQRL
jgi:hypothetical protein